jgi:AAA domain
MNEYGYKDLSGSFAQACREADARERNPISTQRFNGKDKGNGLPFVLFDDIDDVSKQWLVANLFGAGEAAVFYGAPGCGKSVLAEDLGLHISAGMSWHGRAILRGAVLYVALERAKLVKRRARAFAVKHNIRGLPFAVVGGVVNFRDPKTVARIVNTVRAVEAVTRQTIVLIIIDTVSRALAGGDENSSKDMGELITTIGGIQQNTSAAALLLHHVPHEGDRMRGHGNLLGAVDTTVHVVKGIVFRTATVIKANDSNEGEQVGFTLESIDLPGGAQAPVVVPVEVGSTTCAGSTAGSKVNSNQKRFLDILRLAVLETPADLKNTNVVPIGMQAVTRDNLKRHCVAKGWMEEAESNKARAKVSDMLNALAGKHLIGLTDQYVWLAS